MPPKGQQGTTQPRGMLAKRMVRVPARKLSPARTAELIRARERQAQALELRKAGMTYKQIAEALGYKAVSGAENAVKSAIERLGMEAAKDVVLLDLVRLDEFQTRCTAALREGDLSQIDRIMRIMQMRHNLLGITSESYREAIAKQAGTTITNNAVMVIQGSTSTDYVRSMMQAVGVDPNSEAGKAELLKVAENEARAAKNGTAPYQTSTTEPLAIEGGRTVDVSKGSINTDIIEAEIVD